MSADLSALQKAVEEAGEMLAAIGKAQRWGLESVNPELSPADPNNVRDWTAYDRRLAAVMVAEIRALKKKDG